MVDKIAVAIVSQMGKEELIEEDRKEHYVYALIIMTEKIITIGSILVISLFLKQFIPTLFFLGFFLCLRKRTGGYHASSFCRCYGYTILTYVLITFISPVAMEYSYITYGLVILSVILILVLGTINHPNINLDDHELKESKKAARLFVILETMILLSAVLLGINKIYISYMSISIILCAALLCVAKIIKQEV